MSLKEIILKSTNTLLILFILFTVLPVKLNYSSIVIVVLVALSLLNLFTSKLEKVNKKHYIFLLTVPLLVYTLGLLNTTNTDYGFGFLTKNLSFIAFPLTFFSLGNYVNKEKVFKYFLFGLALTNLYLIYLFIYYFNFGTNFYMIVTTDIYHSTYLGMYNLLAYWICIYFIGKENKKLFVLLSMFFLVSAILVSARIVFIAAILSVCGTFLFMLKSKTMRVTAVIVIVLTSAALIFTVPSIKQKFNQVLEIEQLGFDKNNYRSISSRFGKIEASLKVIKKNLWFGTGTGDMIDELVEEYEKMNFVMGFKYRYNPHNQYLDNIVRNGLLGGGISLLIIYIWPIIISYRRKDFLLLAFILIISCVSLTESILDVHKGITFYVFFLTLLMYNNGNKVPNSTN